MPDHQSSSGPPTHRSSLSSFPSLWPYICSALVGVLIALSVSTARGPEGCTLVITGHHVEVHNCPLEHIAQVVSSFSWSRHDVSHAPGP
uniref:Movement protein TGBp3 n=1 Tax=Escobaria virus TaxID=1417306 RepID=V5V0V4_9VIRU|nr:putative triple gene block protein 3 [Escobaria virus]